MSFIGYAIHENLWLLTFFILFAFIFELEKLTEGVNTSMLISASLLFDLFIFLLKWKNHFVSKTDGAGIHAAIPIVNEEYNTGFFDAKKQAEGKEEADPYLIGYCKVHHCVLVTNESKSKPNRIPAVAKKHGVNCIDINDFLNERG